MSTVSPLLAVGIVAGSVTAIITCAYAIAKVYRSVQDAVKRGFSAAVDQSNTGHLVRHHLGPNGTTRPVHERLKLLEAANNIEPGPGDTAPTTTKETPA